MPFMEKRIQSGELLEVERYFCTRDGRKIPRGENVGDTPEDMGAVNERNSRKLLNRLIHCNFSGKAGSLLLLLTHDHFLTEAEAYREERNFIARLNRAREKKGQEPARWIAVTEKQGRWHHHVILDGGMTLEELKELWGDRGLMSVSPLRDTDTYEELAKYLTEAHKPPKGKPLEDSLKPERQKGRRRWHASRNLARPVITKKIIGRPPRPGQPTPPKGYRLLPNWFLGCDMLGNLYTYFSCVREGGEAAHAPKARAGGLNGVRGRSPGGARGGAPRVSQKKKDGRETL